MSRVPMSPHALPAVLIRRFLAVVFIAYGSVKLLGGQFVYDDWTITRSSADGPFLVWAFFGYSPVYARFIALCELIPAILLLVPRTAFAGAVALFPVALNITVMDFAYGFPGVKYMVAAYTLLLAWLLWIEREKLFALFAPLDAVRSALRQPTITHPPAAPSMSRRGRLGVQVLSTLFILWVANMVVESTTDGPERRAVAAANAGGDSLVLKRSRLHGQGGIGRTGTVQVRTAHDTTAVATVYVTRPLGFVPWRVDSVVRR